MMNALLREVEGLGCSIGREGDKLKLDDTRPLSNHLKDKLREHKSKILELLIQQEQAKQKGWLVYSNGEGYEKRVGRNSAVFIFLEDSGNYTVWRGTWKDKGEPYSEKVVIKEVDFDTAFQRANSYVSWFKK